MLTESIQRSVWHGWGDPTQVRAVSSSSWKFLTKKIGVRPLSKPLHPVDMDDVRLPEPRLASTVIAKLGAIVGPDNVRQDRETRIMHMRGKSYLDVWLAWQGDGSAAPDAVIFPADKTQLGEILDLCVTNRIAVVPFGGGTSVVGGVDAEAGPMGAVVTIDMERFTTVKVDTKSRIATLGAGLRGPDVEAALEPYGLTMGHYPQSHQEATVGGYVATRSSGQSSTGYGRIDENVLGVNVVTPAGEMQLGGHTPASAAGPGLRDLIVGSEGTFGIITEATMALHDLPTAKEYASWSFPSFEAATEGLRRMAQELGHGWIPDVCRLSDVDETEVALALAGGSGKKLRRYLALRGQRHPSLALFLWEGKNRSILSARKKHCEAILRDVGGVSTPAVVAKKWEEGRFHGPYMRAYMMSHGVFAETLETATTWDRIGELHSAVGDAIATALEAEGTPGVIQCHISHVYPAGGSLYYTFAAKAANDPVAQWHRVKQAAGKAITEHHGTISHHHSVGWAHEPFIRQEVGDLGVAVMDAVKKRLDPEGILNPGKLIPPTKG